MIGDLLGIDWQWIAGGIGAVLVVIGGWFQRRKGAQQERDRRDKQDAKDYRDERQKIDREVSGVGATDNERIERLRNIARRRGEGPD